MRYLRDDNHIFVDDAFLLFILFFVLHTQRQQVVS